MVSTRRGGPVAKSLWERGAADPCDLEGKELCYGCPKPTLLLPSHGLLMRPYGTEQRGEGRGGGPASMDVTGAVAPLGHL